MSDLKRTEAGDIAIEGGDFVIVNHVDAVAQDVEMALRTWLGESVYDRNAGMPYLQVFFEPGATVESIRFITEQRLLALADVTEVLELEPTVDRVRRELTITGQVRAFGNVFPFSISEVAP